MADTMTLDLETRKAVARLRPLFPVNPSEMHLFTRGPWPANNGNTMVSERWLSDRYVMVNVTGDLTLKRQDVGPGGLEELRDGGYKLTAGKGLVPDPDIYLPDTAALLDLIESRAGEWQELHRTEWSVADSDAKLMLCYTRTGSFVDPYAMNEGIWKAFKAAWPVCEFQANANPELPFRVVNVRDWSVLGYVAKGSFVQATKEQAQAVAALVAL